MINAVSMQRVAHYLYTKHVPVVPKVIQSLVFLLFNSYLPVEVRFGEGSKLAYGGIGVVLHKKCKIGKRVIICQNVTLGKKMGPGEAPVIGDDVYIGPGAKILGNVVVGSNVIIGANTVVTKDVPNNVICAGVPGRIIRSVDSPIYEMLYGYDND